MKERTTGVGVCVHCKRIRQRRCRALCWTCYSTPGVKERYPPTHQGRNSTKKEFPICWACGVKAPKFSNLLKLGWKKRTIRLFGGDVLEVYCPACFDVHGWPPMLHIPLAEDVVK